MGLTAIDDRLLMIESEMGSRRLQQWVVTGSDGAMLIDTGVAGTVTDVIAPALAAAGIGLEGLVEVVITHADVDHYGGDGELRALRADMPIRAHALDRAQIESWQRIAAERYGWYRPHGLDYPPTAWEWLERAAGPDTALSGTVADGELIDLGGVEVEILHLPGHSLGHIGVFLPATRTAIVGDAVMGYGFDDLSGRRASPPPYVDLHAYRGTIERVGGLGATRLCTAHFPLLGGADVDAFLGLSRNFVDDLEREIEAGGGASKPLPQLHSSVAAALGGWPEMEVELARSIGAHFEAGSGKTPEKRLTSGGAR